MSKHINIIRIAMFFILGLFSLSFAQEESMTITTYYPSPYGVYKTLRLHPGPRAAPCQTGEMTYHDGSGGIPAGYYFCDGSSAWQPMGAGYWVASPTDPNSIYNTNTGNVGIGTAAPTATYKLDVNGSVYTSGDLKVAGEDIYLDNTLISDSISSSYLILRPQGNRLMMYDGSSAYALDIWNASSLNIRLNADGNSWIKAGNVGIGTATPAYTLDVTGNLRITGTPYRNGGDIAWQVPSDARLKDIVGNYKYGLAEIAKVNTVRFRFKKDNPLGVLNNKEYVGVIAQEVQKIMPEAVEKGEKGYLTLNSSPIIWAMLNAIKELKTENEISRQRIRALEKRL